MPKIVLKRVELSLTMLSIRIVITHWLLASFVSAENSSINRKAHLFQLFSGLHVYNSFVSADPGPTVCILIFYVLFKASSSTSQSQPSSSSSIPELQTPGRQPVPLAKSAWPDHKVIGYYSSHDAAYMQPSGVQWSLLTHIYFWPGDIGYDYTLNLTGKEVLLSAICSNATEHGVKSVLSIGG